MNATNDRKGNGKLHLLGFKVKLALIKRCPGCKKSHSVL